MEQFSLEKYLADPSKKLVTRDGRKVRIVCTDANMDYPIVALVESMDGTGERVVSFSKEGLYLRNDVCIDDLFFAPEKHEGWVNVYRNSDSGRVYTGAAYDSKEDAEKRKESGENYVTTIKIEWEE